MVVLLEPSVLSYCARMLCSLLPPSCRTITVLWKYNTARFLFSFTYAELGLW